MQENDPYTFQSLAWTPDVMAWADFVLWTRTGWDWDVVYPGGHGKAIGDQRQMLRRARAIGVPVVGYHLDIWFGLNREHQVVEEPFFESTVVITADGGHPDEWKMHGVNHVWMPPGVSAPECELGMFRDEYRSKLAFVGSWQGGYHKEHQHRFQVVEWLQANFRRDCEFWPKPGQHAVRGAALRDLYASVDVVVGDSCFAGSGLPNYWSDRIPETLGRGGYLLHPNVPGLRDEFPEQYLTTWDAGDWDALGAEIDWALTHPDERREKAAAAREFTLINHTYEVRMSQVVDLLETEGLL